jgi:hypothetical protein
MPTRAENSGHQGLATFARRRTAWLSEARLNAVGQLLVLGLSLRCPFREQDPACLNTQVGGDRCSIPCRVFASPAWQRPFRAICPAVAVAGVRGGMCRLASNLKALLPGSGRADRALPQSRVLGVCSGKTGLGTASLMPSRNADCDRPVGFPRRAPTAAPSHHPEEYRRS